MSEDWDCVTCVKHPEDAAMLAVHQAVLNTDTHLSFPCLFEQTQITGMLPQSHEDITPLHPHPQLDVIGKETKLEVFLGGSGFQNLVDCLIVDDEKDYREACRKDGANKR